MLENLLALVKQYAGDAIVNNPAIPNEHNDSAISSVSSSIFDSLKSLISSGGLSQITNMFNGSNPTEAAGVTSGVTSDVISNLMNKFGISGDQAKDIAAKIIPKVMASLVSKTNDPNDSSFDLGSIIQSLSSGGGIMDKLKGLF